MSRCRLFSGSLIARNAGGRGLRSATARHKKAQRTVGHLRRQQRAADPLRDAFSERNASARFHNKTGSRERRRQGFHAKSPPRRSRQWSERRRRDSGHRCRGLANGNPRPADAAANDGQSRIHDKTANGAGSPHSRHFGKTVRLAKLTEHRLIFINTLGESTFLPGDIDEKRRLILALQYAGGRPAGVAGQPDILFFNDRIEHELRRIGQFSGKPICSS